MLSLTLSFLSLFWSVSSFDSRSNFSTVPVSSFLLLLPMACCSVEPAEPVPIVELLEPVEPVVVSLVEPVPCDVVEPEPDPIVEPLCDGLVD